MSYLSRTNQYQHFVNFTLSFISKFSSSLTFLKCYR